MAALGLTAPQTATAVAGSRPASGAKMVWSISYGRLALQYLAFVFAVGMFESADLSSSLTPMSAFHKKMWADGIALHAKLNGLTRPSSSTTTSIVLVHDHVCSDSCCPTLPGNVSFVLKVHKATKATTVKFADGTFVLDFSFVLAHCTPLN